MTIAFLLGALVLLLPAANAANSQTARVVITDLSPFTVYGSGFVARERVTVTVTWKRRYTHRMNATARGSFTVQFATVHLANCTSFVVRAVGNWGTVATKKVVPDCAPPGAIGAEPGMLYPNDPTPKK